MKRGGIHNTRDTGNDCQFVSLRIGKIAKLPAVIEESE